MPISGIGHYTDSSRHYVRLNSGEVVTRTTAENMFAQKWGYANNKELRRMEQSRGFNAFTNRPGYQRGLSEAKASGHTTAEYNATIARYYANEPQNKRDKSTDGPKAKMLEAMGRRSPGSEYRVGESPSVM